jgi:hypothetical protein
MKKIIGTSLALLFACSVFAQIDSILPPYKKFPDFPPVKLLLPDSVTYFTKNDLPKKTAVMLMLFNPQCEHCQYETEELIKNIDKFKNIRVTMSTSMAFDSMLAFRIRYELAQYKNIVVAQATHFFLFSFFNVHHLPFLAFIISIKNLSLSLKVDCR